MIHIVGSPSSNSKAVYYSLRDLGVSCKIVDTPVDFLNAKKVVLPGVGAFGALSLFLKRSNLLGALRDLIGDGAKVLGICLGMQILSIGSEESIEESGLELLELSCKKFEFKNLRVPHTGWDQVSICSSHKILEGLSPEFSAYFSHSYYLPVNEDLTLATTTYGTKFTSIVARENLVGVQFHPERSQRNGRKILSNFADW